MYASYIITSSTLPYPPTPYPPILTQLSDQQSGWLCLAKTLTVTRADAERTVEAYTGALSLPLPVPLPLPLPQSLSPTLSCSSVLPLSLPLTSSSTQPLSVQDVAQSSYGMLHSVPLSALLQVQYVQYVLLILCLHVDVILCCYILTLICSYFIQSLLLFNSHYLLLPTSFLSHPSSFPSSPLSNLPHPTPHTHAL